MKFQFTLTATLKRFHIGQKRRKGKRQMKPRAAPLLMSERPPSPLAWRLALQQHSPARSVASPAGIAAGRGDDDQDGFFDLIRELAVDLLDSVNTDSHSLCSGKQEKCTAHSGGELSHGIIEGALSEATTTTHSATDSVAVSPDNRSRDRSDWSLGLAASPGRLRIPLPIRNFPSSPRPASVSLSGRTSAFSSERRRRTRRSSGNSSVLCELDTVDLLELDRIAQDQPACFTRQHRRPESAQACFDHSSGCQADCSLFPPHNRAPVRSTTSTGYIESDPASTTGVGSAGGSSRVSLRWTLRSPSRQSASGRSLCRPQSASGLPSYLRPSQSYLRSLQEHRPTTPGVLPAERAKARRREGQSREIQQQSNKDKFWYMRLYINVWCIDCV